MLQWLQFKMRKFSGIEKEERQELLSFLCLRLFSWMSKGHKVREEAERACGRGKIRIDLDNTCFFLILDECLLPLSSSRNGLVFFKHLAKVLLAVANQLSYLLSALFM